MATVHSTIPPFPADIDRDAFGHYLSGFADGEGCFMLCWDGSRKDCRPTPKAVFQIALRADDEAILDLIQSYWQCGNLHRQKRHNGKLASEFHVNNLRQLTAVVIPHFDRYPLRAKKRFDYAIWKQAATMMFEAQSKPLHPNTQAKFTRPPARKKARYSEAERSLFASLMAALRKQRFYEPFAIRSTARC